jgi:hypothetical protein
MKPLKTAAIWAAVALIASPVLAQDKVVSSVEVKADLSAYENSNALEYWPSLETDLSQRIAEKISIDDTSEAPRMRVEINKIAINGETLLPDTGEFNQLEGTVTLMESLNETSSTKVDGTTGTALQSFPLVLNAVSANTAVPEGVILIPPSKDDFYAALVDAYATEAIKQIKQ